jgi:hypothetical protein
MKNATHRSALSFISVVSELFRGILQNERHELPMIKMLVICNTLWAELATLEYCQRIWCFFINPVVAIAQKLVF